MQRLFGLCASNGIDEIDNALKRSGAGLQYTHLAGCEEVFYIGTEPQLPPVP